MVISCRGLILAFILYIKIMETKFPILVSTMVLSILVIGIVIVPATSDSLAIRREAATGGRTLAGTGGVGVVAVSPTVPPTVPPVVMPPSGGGLGDGGTSTGGSGSGYIYGWRYDWTSTSTSTCYHCWSRRSWWGAEERLGMLAAVVKLVVPGTSIYMHR